MLVVVMPMSEYTNTAVAMSATAAANSLIFTIFIVFFAFITC